MRIQVKVQTRARKPGIEKTGPGAYKVKVSSPPEKGKANQDVINAMADYFQCPSSWIRIVRGHKSNQKQIEIPDGIRRTIKDIS
ncbi:MAG: DUF167 domain-containing protein [Candidatus Aminicenantes bacterium]